MSASKAVRYKHAAHVASREVEAETIILDLNSSEYYSLNETGSFVWKRLGEGAAPAAIAAQLSELFAVEPAAAAKDVLQLVERLGAEKLLTPA